MHFYSEIPQRAVKQCVVWIFFPVGERRPAKHADWPFCDSGWFLHPRKVSTGGAFNTLGVPMARNPVQTNP